MAERFLLLAVAMLVAGGCASASPGEALGSPAAREVVDKIIAAMGGAERIGSLNCVVLVHEGAKTPVRNFVRSLSISKDGKRFWEIARGGQTIGRKGISNGTPWVWMPSKPNEPAPTALDVLESRGAIFEALLLDENFPARYGGVKSVKWKPNASHLFVTEADGFKKIRYYDAETFLPERIELIKPNGDYSVTVFSRHEVFGGVTLPSEFSHYYNGQPTYYSSRARYLFEWSDDAVFEGGKTSPKPTETEGDST